MKNLNELDTQTFFPNFIPQFRKKLLELREQANTVSFYNKISLVTYCFAGIFILINYQKIFGDNSGIDSLLYIIIAGGAIILVEKFAKEPKEKLNKTKEKIKNNMIIKVCECPDFCTCKEELDAYLKDKGIKLFE